MLALPGEAGPVTPPTGTGLRADIVSRDAGGRPLGRPARLYAAGGRVRIETPDDPAGYFLVDTTAGTAVFVRPDRRIFMDAGQSSRLTRIFIPVDPEAPCRQWQAAARVAGVTRAGGTWRCHRVKADPSAGSRALQYQVLAPGQPPSERWIDPSLRFPVKVTGGGVTLILEHIRIGPQPPALLRVPAGYQRLDPQALIERIRHSDVWVAPPHS